MPDDAPEPRPTPTARARRVMTRPAGAGMAPRPRPHPEPPAGDDPAGGPGAPPPGSGRTATEPATATAERVTEPTAERITAPTTAPATGEEKPKTSRAGRNLPAAIGVGVGLGAVIIASLFVYRPSFAVIVGIATLYGVYEVGQAVRAAGIRITLLPLLIGGAAVLVAAWERGPSGLVVAALVTLVGVLIWRVADGAEGYAHDVGVSAFTLLYVPTLAGFAVLLAHPSDGAGRVLAFVVTVVCSDTGGYAAGVLFGKHPLAPVVSKAKTWEGVAGSVVACCAAGVLFMIFTFHQPWWAGVVFGLGIVITATVGDLGESMIKRDVGIKDMGRLLPGHGGVMDRLDSLLPCAAVAYLLLSYFA